ncbi:MAG: hypothetical protein RLZ98_3431 [Pseudomonadota bacterium]|jgi:hypothetical protein
MSLSSLPLLVIAFVLYNAIVLFGGTGEPDVILSNQILPDILLISGGIWKFSWGDLIVLMILVLLFIEIVKATYTSSASLLDHGLSMLVFVACLVEFLVVKQAATSVFFTLMVASLIDVVAGYTIGIRVARRDLAIGG